MPQQVTRTIDQGTQQFSEAARGPDGFVPEKPLRLPSAHRRRKAPLELDGADLLDLPAYVLALDSRPVEKAYGQLRAAVEVAEEASHAVRRLAADERAEDGRIRSEALESGDSTAQPRTDWGAERAIRERRFIDARAEAVRAQRHLLEVAKGEIPKKLPGLVQRAADARSAARKAVASAQDAVAEAVDLARIIRELDRAEEITPARWWQSKNTELESNAARHLREVQQYLDVAERDRFLAGSYILEPVTDQVPAETVEKLLDSNSQPLALLALGILAVQEPEHRAVRANPAHANQYAESARGVITTRAIPRY